MNELDRRSFLGRTATGAAALLPIALIKPVLRRASPIPDEKPGDRGDLPRLAGVTLDGVLIPPDQIRMVAGKHEYLVFGPRPDGHLVRLATFGRPRPNTWRVALECRTRSPGVIEAHGSLWT
jgi:hypothetical protein